MKQPPNLATLDLCPHLIGRINRAFNALRETENPRHRREHIDEIVAARTELRRISPPKLSRVRKGTPWK